MSKYQLCESLIFQFHQLMLVSLKFTMFVFRQMFIVTIKFVVIADIIGAVIIVVVVAVVVAVAVAVVVAVVVIKVVVVVSGFVLPQSAGLILTTLNSPLRLR